MTLATRTKTAARNERDETRRAPGALELRHVEKVFGSRHSTQKAVDDFSLSVEPGQFVTLLGPSGCGKTTTLRMIAGFETPTAGDILIDGRSVLSVLPNKRPMSMVFQSYALFPHLTVEDNVGFGLTARHASKAARATRVGQVMELMGIAPFAARYPHELSGGQQQRVALARALVMEPSILLFDEPLSNLDAKLRMRMREEIRALQQRVGITSVFVTHDQSEAMTMSDLVVVMKDGRIRQVGSPQQIYHHPADTFVASFLGTANFVDVLVHAVEGGGRDITASVSVSGALVAVPSSPGLEAGSAAKLLLRSENLHVVPAGSETAPGPRSRHLEGRVLTGSFDGAITRYSVETAHGVLQGQSPGTEPSLAPGTVVSCLYDPAATWLLGGAE